MKISNLVKSRGILNKLQAILNCKSKEDIKDDKKIKRKIINKYIFFSIKNF